MHREMVKITMLKTDTGAPEGHTVVTYGEGKSYDVPADLARVFVKERKSAEYFKPRAKGDTPASEKPSGAA